MEERAELTCMSFGFVLMTRSHKMTRLHDPAPASRLTMTETLKRAESNEEQQNLNQRTTDLAVELPCILPLGITIDQAPLYCNTFLLKSAPAISGKQFAYKQ